MKQVFLSGADWLKQVFLKIFPSGNVFKNGNIPATRAAMKLAVQVCDATAAAQRFAAGYPKKQLNSMRGFGFRCSLALLVLSTACNSSFVPKPEGYFKIDFPEKKYQQFNEPGYPYTFEYPVYATVSKDSSFFNETPENPWWINIQFPQFHSNIYISYKLIGPYKLDKLINDAYHMTSKHTVKASAIDESPIKTSNNVSGMFFKVSGEVATANQFFLTDSTKNFLRGALYFEATPNQDSLRPVNDFLVADMQHLINSFKWK